MTDSFLLVPTGDKVDTSQKVVNANIVQRQRMLVGGEVNQSNYLEPTPQGALLVELGGQIKELTLALKNILDASFVDPLGTGALRTMGTTTVSGSLTTVTTVTSCTTVAGITNIGAVPANSLITDTMDMEWANTVRRCVT